MHKQNRIGFHARNWAELERVVNIEGVSLVELKPDKLKERDNIQMYFYDGKSFVINEPIVKEIKAMCDEKGIHAQIHLPFEKKYDDSEERGLCQAEISHHPMILARYEMFGRLLDDYGIGYVLTTHPPSFGFGKKQLWSEQQSLEAGIELYAKVDMLIKEKGYRFKLGIENMMLPKKSGPINIGYKPEHIDMLIGNTSEIGITVDSGHRRLNDEMSVSKLFSYGHVVNVHFHSNAGIFSAIDYKDDEHILATRENLPYYNRYLKTFRRFRMPIVLEIGKLDKSSDEELGRYVMNLRKEIN
ncbi:MAG: hypothetical protein U9R34_03060 [Nanoarchaeota archaeon]|nr:hypothetical protein [Nanoarchaeota archaeon]